MLDDLLGKRFEEARTVLRERARDFKSASDYWKVLDSFAGFGKGAFHEFLNPDISTDKFTPKARQKLVSFVFPEMTPPLYSTVAQLINQSDHDRKRLESYCGTYVYVRRNQEHGKKNTLSSGLIKVLSHGQAVWFEHHPDTAVTEKNTVAPKHKGLVTLVNNRMYFLGIHTHYMVLAISLIPDATSKGYFHGVVLTSYGHAIQTPNAYSFVMVHEDHPEFKTLAETKMSQFQSWIKDCSPFEGLLKVSGS